MEGGADDLYFLNYSFQDLNGPISVMVQTTNYKLISNPCSEVNRLWVRGETSSRNERNLVAFYSNT